MPSFDHIVETDIQESLKTVKLRALFDVPQQEKSTLKWHCDLPIEDRDWNVGLIVGPSGCGKTQILGKIWPISDKMRWPKSEAVIDSFPSELSVEEISNICNAVGFNTIPAWLRPYSVLSNGEKFRVMIARLLAEKKGDIVIVDEFTSVIDRQVAKITSHAVQKYIRRNERQFVAATCHYDVIDWLQPDWTYEPATNTFTWRSLQQRPKLGVEVRRVKVDTWRIFAPYHYLSADINTGATCFAAFVNGQPVSFTGVIHRPYKKRLLPLFAMQRSVTLPDWQGMGVIFYLNSIIGGAYRILGARIRAYPAHHALVNSLNRSKDWRIIRKPGLKRQTTEDIDQHIALKRREGRKTRKIMGLRPCAVFEYCGPLLSMHDALELLGDQAWVKRQLEERRVKLPQCRNDKCIGKICSMPTCLRKLNDGRRPIAS